MDFVDQLSPQEIKEKLPKAHPTAIISKSAEIDATVAIGPNAYIGAGVKLDKNVKIHNGVFVSGSTFIGEGTEIHPFASVGTAPQVLKYAGEKTSLKIGKHNQIREYVNISIGTQTGGALTSIGDHNLFMAFSHIAHDCIIGNRVIVANGVQIAGHVEVGDHSVFGGLAGIHQFSRIGKYVMVGAGSIVVQDIPPFCMVQGDRARQIGLNVVGIRRSPFSKEEKAEIKLAYKLLYADGRTLDE